MKIFMSSFLMIIYCSVKQDDELGKNWPLIYSLSWIILPADKYALINICDQTIGFMYVQLFLVHFLPQVQISHPGTANT